MYAARQLKGQNILPNEKVIRNVSETCGLTMFIFLSSFSIYELKNLQEPPPQLLPWTEINYMITIVPL